MDEGPRIEEEYALDESGIAAERLGMMLVPCIDITIRLPVDGNCRPHAPGFGSSLVRCVRWTMRIPVGAVPALAALSATGTPRDHCRRSTSRSSRERWPPRFPEPCTAKGGRAQVGASRGGAWHPLRRSLMRTGRRRPAVGDDEAGPSPRAGDRWEVHGRTESRASRGNRVLPARQLRVFENRTRIAETVAIGSHLTPGVIEVHVVLHLRIRRGCRIEADAQGVGSCTPSRRTRSYFGFR